MSSDSWQRLKVILDGALEREAGAREGYLREACGGDAELLREAESFLAFSEESGAGLDVPVIAAAEPEHESRIGQKVGAYELVSEVGHGGMGTVYLARRADEQFRKRVAVKLVRRGMDTDAVLRRFRRERQILAGLDHPHIARLLDGGVTEDGVPYFVMEYVEGQPLSDYCDGRRLSVTERLKLFLDVCSAVQFAHQNLVVHRDLKPANVLVTGEGKVKLLDFGIAKLLNPDFSSHTLEPTASALRLMTPDYASPEQVRGEPVTTASDVYSLGVVLYELLTGHRPYRVRTREPQEIARVICQQEPEKPSTAVKRVEEADVAGTEGLLAVTPESVSATREGEPKKLQRRLQGDLDNIVLMAMRKEPQRRYASVEQLAEDIRRHLDGRPVLARKDTAGYRAGKFARRNRLAISAAALVFVSLVAGIGVALHQAAIARTERARAERRFNDVRKLAKSFLFEFQDSIKNLAGSTPARELLVRRGLEYLDSLASEAGGDSQLLRDLAQGYRKLGELQGDLGTGSAILGDMDGAVRSYRKAQAIQERLVRTTGATAEDRLALADLYTLLSDPIARGGDTAMAIDLARKALAIGESVSATEPATSSTWQRLSFYNGSLGVALKLGGRREEALEAFQKGVTLIEKVSFARPADTRARRSVAIAHVKVADTLDQLGNSSGSLAEYRQALAIETELAARDPANAQFARDLSFVYENMAHALGKSGDVARAVESSRKAVQIRRELAAADPKNPNPRLWLAGACEQLGKNLLELGEVQPAMRTLREALGLLEPVLQSIPGDAIALEIVAETEADMGDACRKAFSTDGRLESLREARSWFEKSRKTYADLQSHGRLPDEYAGDVGEVTRKLTDCGAQLVKLGGGRTRPSP